MSKVMQEHLNDLNFYLDIIEKLLQDIEKERQHEMAWEPSEIEGYEQLHIV